VARYQKRKSTCQRGCPSKRSKNQDNDTDLDNDDEVECFYCLKKGYFQSNCCLKRKANKKRKKREKQEAKVSLAAAIEAPSTAKEATILDANIW